MYDLSRAMRDAGVPVIGGFQSPMEKECLRILLRGDQPVVVCPARGIENMRIPREWREAAGRGPPADPLPVPTDAATPDSLPAPPNATNSSPPSPTES